MERTIKDLTHNYDENKDFNTTYFSKEIIDMCVYDGKPEDWKCCEQGTYHNTVFADDYEMSYIGCKGCNSKLILSCG